MTRRNGPDKPLHPLHARGAATEAMYPPLVPASFVGAGQKYPRRYFRRAEAPWSSGEITISHRPTVTPDPFAPPTHAELILRPLQVGAPHPSSVSTNSPRTSAMCRSSVSTRHPSVGTGGCTTTSTVVGRITSPCFGSASREVLNTIGTMGTPAPIATWKAPFLNGPRRGGGARR